MTKQIPFSSVLLAATICVALLGPSAQAQVQWAKRIASTTSLSGGGGPDIGLALDSQANCYVTGWFDGTNNFGGVTLTNQSVGGSDIFVAKYSSTGALQWAQRAGGTSTNMNTGRCVGVDTSGNVYVAGHVYGPASFGGINLPASAYQNFFLAKYNSTGAVQWVRQSVAGYDIRFKGLAVDGAGNSYALLYLMGQGIVTLGLTNVTNPTGDDYSLAFVKFDNTGTVQWAQLLGAPDGSDTSGCGVAVDPAGINVYVCGLFEASLTIGTSSLTGSATSWNIFVAKFNNLGALTWVQQPTGGNPRAGFGAAVDPAGNVYVAGQFTNTISFGGISVTNGGGFVAKYSTSGAIRWARQTGGSNTNFYYDVALDGQTNVYAAGLLNSGAAVAKYNPTGTLQWAYSASGPPASPYSSVAMKCAGDSTGHCYLAGWYQGTNTFGTNVLQPQETWNFFLAETVTNPTVQFTASPTSGLPPLTVQFNSTNVDNQGNTISSWKWNFGDGTTTNAQNPSHTYTNTGTFNPSFVATNNHNVAVIGYGPQIAVTNPIILFTANPTNGLLPLAVQFNAAGVDSAGNNIISWNWNFGDGVTTNGQYPSHTYTNAGTFNPTLVATNNQRIALIGFGPQITTLTSASPTNLTYTIQNGTVTITGYIGSGGVVNIPPAINGYPVTDIGNGAFMNCTNLTSAAIQGGTIGDDAFNGCTSLTNVTLGTNVTSIGAYAFSGGHYFGNTLYGGGDPLRSITIPTSVTNIGHYAFYDCTNLSSAAIQGGAIGDYAFFYCTSLTNVTLGTNVTSIGAYAFSGDYYWESTVYYEGDPLSSITIPNSVTSIGTNAFYGCTKLTSAAIQGGAIGDYAFFYCTSLTNVTLGTNVTSIGAYAFSGGYYNVNNNYFIYEADPLSIITIPNSVTSIGDYAFYYCTSLTSAAIQGGAIGDYAFSVCYSLTSVTLGTNVTSIGAYAFSGYYGGDPLSSITIPNSVTNIGDYAFYDTFLTSVTIPNSVNNIGDYAFCYCLLTSAAIQGGAIGDYAFYACFDLTNVTLGTNVTRIGAYAFSGYYGGDPLSSITIPNSVTSIGTNAFYDCGSLAGISVDTQNADYSSLNGVLFDKNQTTLIQYPGGQIGSYTIPNSVTSIGDDAFYGASLTSVTIPNSATNIGTNAFSDCYSLTSAAIQGGAIGDYAFYDCTNLTNVTLGTNVTSIGAYAFSGENYEGDPLSSITIPNSVTSIGAYAFSSTRLTSAAIQGGAIGDYAFYDCTSLTNVTLGTNVTSIGDDAFYYCYRLTNVTIHNSVTNIGDYAFYECTSLTSAAILGGAIGDHAFYDCSSLTNVTLGTNVTSIGAYAFSGDYGGGPLSSITIPNSVTSIGAYAFFDCTSLTNVTLGINVTSIGAYAFSACTRLTSITIPNSVTSIGDYAFFYCYLHQAYFQGNAPTVDGQPGSVDSTVFSGESGTAYYLPGTTGWGATFGGWPTAGWYQPKPRILGIGYGLGARSNSFGFTISWATNLSIIVQATTNLANPVWTPLATNLLVGGTNYFSDPKWTNYPGRFYRLSAP